MAKSKTRRRKHNRQAGGDQANQQSAEAAPKKRLGAKPILYGLIALGVGAIGFGWWDSAKDERAFMALVAEGKAAPGDIKVIRSDGRGHLTPGQTQRYRSRFPTSGIHEPIWTTPGVYDLPQPPTRLVHALEHGHIVIYFDEPGDEAMATIKQWSDLYSAPWNGIVATKMLGLGRKLVLTAWTRRLDLDPFAPAAAARFIDAFRGRGPENPVR
ncbi:MAG: DUF3105 domain-containing protein [Alphaproteobacteria bacterium]|nr:DUF3105 domain-containing protein [Alphaproteobacteria bacterium]